MVEEVFGKLIGDLFCPNEGNEGEGKQTPQKCIFYIQSFESICGYFPGKGPVSLRTQPTCNNTGMFATAKSLIQLPAPTLEVFQHIVVWVKDLSAIPPEWLLLHLFPPLSLSFPISKMMGHLKNYSRMGWESSTNTGEATALALEVFFCTPFLFFSFVKKEGFLCVWKEPAEDHKCLEEAIYVCISTGAWTVLPEPGWCTCRRYWSRGKMSSSRDGGDLHRADLQVASSCSFTWRAWWGETSQHAQQQHVLLLLRENSWNEMKL